MGGTPSWNLDSTTESMLTYMSAGIFSMLDFISIAVKVALMRSQLPRVAVKKNNESSQYEVESTNTVIQYGI